MQFVAHRINTIEELKKVPREYGVEIDVRSIGQELVLSHDPFVSGEHFDEWIKHYKHKLLIINIKEEGIERAVLNIVNKNNIKNYFFLDVSFPYLIKLMRQGEKKVAVRVSEFESIETALALKNKVDWVWIDCFSKLPLSRKDYLKLSRYFKTCIVSPELQGFSLEKISEFKSKLRNFSINAVCTKRIDLWIQ